jgi:hypothetical protein
MERCSFFCSIVNSRVCLSRIIRAPRLEDAVPNSTCRRLNRARAVLGYSAQRIFDQDAVHHHSTDIARLSKAADILLWIALYDDQIS